MSRHRTVVGEFVHSRWTALHLRCRNGKYKHLSTVSRCQSYDAIDICLTREEFKAWCWSHRELIEALVRPSIDRIDKAKHYTLDNMQIIELAENIRKDKTVFKDGFGVCYSCHESKPEQEFAVSSRRANGRSSLCAECDRRRGREKYARLYKAS